MYPDQSVMIRVSQKTRDTLRVKKAPKGETYDEIIKRLLSK